MKHSKSRWLAAALTLVFLAGLTNARAAEQEQPNEKKRTPAPKPTTPATRRGAPEIQPGAPGPQRGEPGTQPGVLGRPGGPGLQRTDPATRRGEPPMAKPPVDNPVRANPPVDNSTRPKPPADNSTSPKPTTRQTEPATPPTRTPAQTRTPTRGPDPSTTPPRTSDPTKTSTRTPDSTTTPTRTPERTTIPPRTAAPTTTPPPRPLPPQPAPVKLATNPTRDGGYTKTAPSGQVRERAERKADGEHIQRFTPAGRVQTEVVQKPDGTRHITEYDLGRREKRAEVVRADRSRETTDVHYNRNGEVRSRETVKVDARGTAVSKTVVVKQNVVIKNTTIVNNTVVRNYHPGRYGFVYRPVVVRPAVFVSWYDPFWYAPPVVFGGPFVAITTHRFSFSWGWYAEPWYAYHRVYWEPYPVYVAPSYWVTDWMMAGYLADRYAVSVSAAQTLEEARLAREEAEKARLAAEQARDAAEIAEAKAAQAAAEARAERAEARAAKAEAEEAKRKELAGKPNPNATPIDKDTKEALKNQVEKTIAEKKEFAEQSAKGGNPVAPDVSKALADPNHIYPVSKTIGVTRAKDGEPAGTLTAGDLLKLEPGQEIAKDVSENTFVTMRVMTSKGEDDSVPAGTLINLPLKELQEFDNEFRAKLDLGLAEAEKNQDQFKKSAL